MPYTEAYGVIFRRLSARATLLFRRYYYTDTRGGGSNAFILASVTFRMVAVYSKNGYRVNARYQCVGVRME